MIAGWKCDPPTLVIGFTGARGRDAGWPMAYCLFFGQ